MKDIVGVEEFKYFVPTPVNYNKIAFSIIDWLYQFEEMDYIVLYHQYTEADGQWHSGPSSKAIFVAFKNEEDAVAFKLKWT